MAAITLTDQNFEQVVMSTDKPVVIDFWAEWCGPCRMISPIIAEMAEEYKDRAVVCKLDVDSNPQTAMRFKIRNIPTVLFVKKGEIVDKQVGAVPKAMLVKKLEALL